MEDGPEEAKLEVGICSRYLLHDRVLRQWQKDKKQIRDDVNRTECGMIKEPRITPVLFQWLESLIKMMIGGR